MKRSELQTLIICIGLITEKNCRLYAPGEPDGFTGGGGGNYSLGTGL